MIFIGKTFAMLKVMECGSGLTSCQMWMYLSMKSIFFLILAIAREKENKCKKKQNKARKKSNAFNKLFNFARTS